MSNYWGHTIPNVVMFSAFTWYLGYKSGFTPEIALFWLHAMFHTVISCDIDHPNSKPARMLGWVWRFLVKHLTHHRGILHNPYFWTAFYAVIYTYIYFRYGYNAWWLSGGVLALYAHRKIDDFTDWKERALPW